MSYDDPRPYDPSRHEAAPEPAPAPEPMQTPRAQADHPAMEERWAFRSRTIQRICVAGVMFLLSKEQFAQYAPFVDQGMVTDFVRMVFDALPQIFEGLTGLAMAGAIRAKQIGDVEPPVKLYWLPRPREMRQPAYVPA